jgi:hypothetical protein
MVNVIRHFYDEVVFIVPDVALSAGTVFVMSGDEILMDYYSCLGPIDPQVERDGKLVPALSYLVQYDRLIDKATAGTLTNAEFAILNKHDLAELHQFEMARDLSISLLRNGSPPTSSRIGTGRHPEIARSRRMIAKNARRKSRTP